MKLFILKVLVKSNINGDTLSDIDATCDVYIFKTENERDDYIKENFANDVENELMSYINDGKLYKDSDFEDEEDFGYYDLDEYHYASRWDEFGCGVRLEYKTEEVEI